MNSLKNLEQPTNKKETTPLRVSITEHEGRAIIDLGVSVSNFGLEPVQALQFGKAVVKTAKKLLKKQGVNVKKLKPLNGGSNVP